MILIVVGRLPRRAPSNNEFFLEHTAGALGNSIPGFVELTNYDHGQLGLFELRTCRNFRGNSQNGPARRCD